MRTRLIFAALSASIAFLTTSGTILAQGLPPQSTSASGVTVKATPKTLAGPVWAFEIVFDTHSQDLKDDLVKSASLAADGRKIVPTAWQGDPPGGHHRKGVLSFDAAGSRPQAIELTIVRAGEANPRVFRWQLK